MVELIGGQAVVEHARPAQRHAENGKVGKDEVDHEEPP
jgi:hypothetical protein